MRLRRPPRFVRDGLDATLIELLQADGRRPNTDIARRVRVAEATVRHRIARLLREKVIHVGAVADPLKIGYQTWAVMEIQVRPPMIDAVARALTERPEIIFLGLCTGSCDFVATALFRSPEHMGEFLTGSASRIEGIERISTLSILRVLKREYAYPVVRGEAVADARRTDGGREETGAERGTPRGRRAGRVTPRSRVARRRAGA